MKGFIFKTTGIIAVSFLLSVQLFAQFDFLNRFFNLVKNIVIANAEQLNNWKNEADNAAKITINDFTECPSPAAQNLYDDLKRKQDQARETKRQADEADRQAQEARDRCKRTTRLNAQCDSSYNSFSFRATSQAAAETISSIEAALNTLKNLRCPAGCDKTARIVYPTIQLKERNIGVTVRGRDLGKVFVPPVGIIEIPYPVIPEITYCSVWKPGEFWVNWDTGNGEFNGDWHAKLPQCERTETISVCTDWDLNLLLPKLQKLNIVPPDVSVADLVVEIPNRDVTGVTGVKQTNCNHSIRVPRRTTVTVNFDLSSDPLSILTGQGGEMTEIGCSDPAFGLEPVTTTVSLPDLTRVKVSWKGITVKGGYIEVDMTNPEFRAICKKGAPASLKLPTVIVEKGYLDFPEVCLQPRFNDLIGRK